MIIISLIPESKDQIMRIKKMYPDYYLEYRLDLCPSWDFIDAETVNDKVIMTIRDKDESAGEVTVQPVMGIKEKIKLYRKWINRYNCLVDLELSSIEKLTSLQLLSINPANIIISVHEFDHNWNMPSLAQKCLYIEKSGVRLGKIALAHTSWKHLSGLEKLFRMAGIPFLIAFMDYEGIGKRCLYRHIGAVGTYVSLAHQQTAEGQLSINLAEKLRLNQITGRELLGGIIGGEQVVHSAGINHYNNLFRKKDLSAVYLPLIIRDFTEFSMWLQGSIFKDKVYGFSITMPHKRSLKNIVNNKLNIVNLWDGKEEVFNTDTTGLNKLMETKNMNTKLKKVLILGSGASAEMAMQAIGKKANVILSSRNFPKGINLCQNYGGQYLIPENLKDKYFDLLINTTPLGMNNEDIFDFAPGIKFGSVIDLPYSSTVNPLGKYCAEKDIDYISGRDFWKYQAEKQEEFFLEKINARRND